MAKGAAAGGGAAAAAPHLTWCPTPHCISSSPASQHTAQRSTTSSRAGECEFHGEAESLQAQHVMVTYVLLTAGTERVGALTS